LRERTCPIVIDGEGCRSGFRIVRGVCLFHYRQMVAGVPFKRHVPARPRGRGLERRDGRKECAHCLLWRDLDEFGPAAKAADGLQPWCSQCIKDYMSLRRYGLTRGDVERRVQEQGGCAACGVARPRNEGFRNGWHVDHDHACCPGGTTCGRCIRGILCADCNKLLGLVGDDVSRLLAAVNYLRDCEARHERETAPEAVTR
jgi:hypothetical protein